MLGYKLLLVIVEGMVFGLFSLGLFISFQWLRFPDLTPDGSFVLGACIYVKVSSLSVPFYLAFGLSMGAGFALGIITAILNKVARIPAVLAGLLTSTATFSICWLLLGKPNQFLRDEYSFFRTLSGIKSSMSFVFLLVCLSSVVLLFLNFIGNSIGGLKLKAIGENPLLRKDINANELLYTSLGLGLANSIVALSGVLFLQRSYSADINMGIGQTVIGLIGMILGLILARRSRNFIIIGIAVLLGAIIHKAIVFLTLETGIPAESFRLVSTSLFILILIILRASGIDILKKVKWS